MNNIHNKLDTIINTLKGASIVLLLGYPLGTISGGLLGTGAGHLFGGIGAKLSARKRVNRMFKKSRSIDED